MGRRTEGAPLLRAVQRRRGGRGGVKHRLLQRPHGPVECIWGYKERLKGNHYSAHSKCTCLETLI